MWDRGHPWREEMEKPRKLCHQFECLLESYWLHWLLILSAWFLKAPPDENVQDPAETNSRDLEHLLLLSPGQYSSQIQQLFPFPLLYSPTFSAEVSDGYPNGGSRTLTANVVVTYRTLFFSLIFVIHSITEKPVVPSVLTAWHCLCCGLWPKQNIFADCFYGKYKIWSTIL